AVLTESHFLELSIDDVDLSVEEVGGEKEVRALERTGCDGLVVGAVGRRKADLTDPGNRAVAEWNLVPNRWVPADDRAVVRSEDEDRRPGIHPVSDREVGRVAIGHDRLIQVEQLAGRRSTRDGDLEQGPDRSAVHVTQIEFAEIAAVGGYPESTAVWRQGDSLSAVQGGVHELGQSRQIGHQVGLQETCRRKTALIEPFHRQPRLTCRPYPMSAFAANFADCLFHGTKIKHE